MPDPARVSQALPEILVEATAASEPARASQVIPEILVEATAASEPGRVSQVGVEVLAFDPTFIPSGFGPLINFPLRF